MDRRTFLSPARAAYLLRIGGEHWRAPRALPVSLRAAPGPGVSAEPGETVPHRQSARELHVDRSWSHFRNLLGQGVLPSPFLPIYAATGDRPAATLVADDFDLLLDLAYDRVSRTWYVLYRDPIQAGVKAIDSQHRTRLWRLPTWLIPESILFRAGGVVRLLGVNLEETLRSLTPGFHADDYSYIGLEVSLQSTTPGVPGEIQVTQLGRGGGQVLDYDLGLDPHRISHRRAVARQLAQDLSFQHISLGARSLTRSRIAYSPRDTWMAWSHPMFPNTWLHLLDTGTGAPTQRDLAAFGPVRDLHPPETAIVAITTTGGVTSVGLVSRTQGQAVQRVVRFNQWDGRLRLLQEAPGLLARPLERWPGEPLDFVFR